MGVMWALALRVVSVSCRPCLQSRLSSLKHRPSSWTWRSNARPRCHSPVCHQKNLYVRPLLDSPEKRCSNPAFSPRKKPRLCLPLSPGKVPYPRLPVFPSKRLLAGYHLFTRRDLHSCALPRLSMSLPCRGPWLPRTRPSILPQLPRSRTSPCCLTPLTIQKPLSPPLKLLRKTT